MDAVLVATLLTLASQAKPFKVLFGASCLAAIVAGIVLDATGNKFPAFVGHSDSCTSNPGARLALALLRQVHLQSSLPVFQGHET